MMATFQGHTYNSLRELVRHQVARDDTGKTKPEMVEKRLRDAGIKSFTLNTIKQYTSLENARWRKASLAQQQEWHEEWDAVHHAKVHDTPEDAYQMLENALAVADKYGIDRFNKAWNYVLKLKQAA